MQPERVASLVFVADRRIYFGSFTVSGRRQIVLLVVFGVIKTPSTHLSSRELNKSR
jgi:hypothetical protein